MARSKYEIRAHKELEERGWEVDWKVRPGGPIRGYNVDFFGLFDIIAYKPRLPLRCISVKPAKNVSVEHQRALKMWNPAGIFTIEIWKYDRDPKNKSKIRRRILSIN